MTFFIHLLIKKCRKNLDENDCPEYLVLSNKPFQTCLTKNVSEKRLRNEQAFEFRLKISRSPRVNNYSVFLFCSFLEKMVREKKNKKTKAAFQSWNR